MHHAFVVRAGPDVVGLCVIAVGVCWTVGRPEGGRGCVWAGLSPRLGPGGDAGYNLLPRAIAIFIGCLTPRWSLVAFGSWLPSPLPSRESFRVPVERGGIFDHARAELAYGTV